MSSLFESQNLFSHVINCGCIPRLANKMLFIPSFIPRPSPQLSPVIQIPRSAQFSELRSQQWAGEWEALEARQLSGHSRSHAANDGTWPHGMALLVAVTLGVGGPAAGHPSAVNGEALIAGMALDRKDWGLLLEAGVGAGRRGTAVMFECSLLSKSDVLQSRPFPWRLTFSTDPRWAGLGSASSVLQ